MTVSLPGRVDRRLRGEHGDILQAVDSCAAMVAADWDGQETANRSAVVPPLRRHLEQQGVLATLPAVLADVVEFAGYSLPATPVAAPPYVVITSRGPLLRATIEPGRLVVVLEAFNVVRGPTPAYRRIEPLEVAVTLE